MTEGFIKRYKLIIKLTRPRTLLWFSISSCYGFGGMILNKIPPPHFLFLVLSIVFANIGAITVNDISDIDVDSKSIELVKKERPLVRGDLSIRDAWLLVLILFFLSILVSLAYGLSGVIFSIVIILFSLSYSLPPFRFSGRPFSSILFWIVLCIVCYVLMVFCLENIDSDSRLKFYSKLYYSKQGLIFVSAIILFMGIAEVISKDLRDMKNDFEGGRNTFVNHVGINRSINTLFVFALLGFTLWMISLYVANIFPRKLTSFICFITGVFWCMRIYVYGTRLKKRYTQSIALKLHEQWTTVYLIMQLATILSFV